MTPDDVIAEVQKIFAGVPRPEAFIRGTCHCDECLEHDRTLAAHTPATITLKELGSPAWDPMCFANDDAFRYYMPALIRLAFEDEYYVDQLLFHLNCPGRVEAMTAPEAQAVQAALWALVENKGQTVLDNLNAQFIEQAIEKLEQRLTT